MVMQTLHRTVPNSVGTIDRSNAQKTEYCTCGRLIARLPLSKGLEAIVHQEDALKLAGRKYYADVNRTRPDKSQLVYARRRADRHTAPRLHEEIAQLHGVSTRGKQIDHANGDTLDNRWICNLRVVTHAENVQNHPPRRGKAIAHKGISKEGEFYVAKFRVNGETKRLGSFKTLEEAIVRYNWEVLQKTGPIGRLNSIEPVQEVA